MKRIAIALVLFAATSARADDDPAARGEALAKAGDYSRAIDAFKAADRQHPSARNACMIGLAYLRREAWPQAEVFLTQCKERASANDSLPDWFGAAEQQLTQKLAAANVAAVTLVVEPDVATATATVSSFAPDERFAPRTIHLAPGKHTFEVRAPGYETELRTIDIVGTAPVRVVVTLYREGERPLATTRSRVPLYVMGAGLVLGAATAAYSLAVVRPLRDELATTHDIAIYNRKREDFVTDRAVAYGLGAAAGVVLITGIVLRYTVYAPERVHVAASVERGGGMVTLTLER